MARHAFLAGYIACKMALWFLVLFRVFPALMEKLPSITIPIAFTFPLAMKNFPWVALIAGSSFVSKVIAILLCLTCYLVSTLIVLVVLQIGLFIYTLALGKYGPYGNEAFVVIACITFVVMDMLLSYSNKLVNDMQVVTVLVEKTSFTSQLLSNFPFSIKATLLDPAVYLVGMLATLLALPALTFLVVNGLSHLAILLPLDMYPRLRFTTIIGLPFIVTRYMVAKSSLISGLKATLIGLVVLINHYRVAYLVVRYATFLVLVLLPQVTTCGDYYKVAIIISLGVLLTMRPGPSTPIKHPTRITGASTGSLDHFITFSVEIILGHKMATQKIISKLNLLIEDSKGEIQSSIVHGVLILLTLICATMFYVLSQYPVWINNMTRK